MNTNQHTEAHYENTLIELFQQRLDEMKKQAK